MVTSADSCRTGEVGGVGTVGLVCIIGLLRMGCGLFLIPVCGFVGGGETSGAEYATMGTFCWVLRTNAREEGQRQKAYLCREGRGETETESLILWLVVLELLAGGWGLREVQSLI